MRKKRDNKSNKRWIVMTIMWTFVLSGAVNLASGILLESSTIFLAFIVLIAIIFIGIIFDIIGIATASADNVPFHSMAARRVYGARTAIKLIRNAEKVSNFCNDVIGDIAGVISGGAAVVISTKLCDAYPFLNSFIVSLVLSALVAAMTVGGKAMGKSLAISKSNDIVYIVSKLISIFNNGRKK